MRKRLNQAVAAWLAVTARHRWPVLTACLALSALSLWFAVANIGINTNTSNMVRQDARFRVAEDTYWAQFPAKQNTILAVLQGGGGGALEEATDAIAGILRANPDRFTTVYAPGAGAFFRQNGLLYLTADEVADTVDGLAGGQAALGKLAEDPSLRGLLSALGSALDAAENGEDVPAALTSIMAKLADAADRVAAGEQPRIDLLADAMPEAGGTDLRVIVVGIVHEYDRPLSAEASILRFYELVDELRQEGAISPEVEVRLTGEDVLGYEELLSVESGIAIAGIVSLFALAVILGWGLRSARLIFACYATLLVGFCWMAAFAALAVGELNLISVSCAVLFIGLGIDHAIHVCLRFVEARRAGEETPHALVTTGGSLGGALTLATITSAIGFLSFVPTDYVGFADLGRIAAGGMLMAWLAALTFLPALLAVIGAPRRAIDHEPALPVAGSGAPRAVAWGVIVLAVVALPLLTQARFDFSTLAIKNPEMESMQALADLERAGGNSDYSAWIVAPSLEDANALAREFRARPEVENAITLSDYVPGDQDEKLAIIEEAAFFLWPALNPSNVAVPPSGADRLEAVDAFLARAGDAGGLDEATGKALEDLVTALKKLRGEPDPEAAVGKLEDAAIPGAVAQIARLRDALEAQPVGLDDLPGDLVAWEMRSDGKAIVTVTPSGDMGDYPQLEAFADAVTEIAPMAVGRPVAEVATGRIVVGSFQAASLLALISITILLGVIFRRVSDVLLVLIPLMIAFSLTVAATVLLDMPFNFANVIVLPLLLGFGVDSGIHLVSRRRQRVNATEVMQSSTPRAVLLSALTTIASFGSLSLSPHLGTASLGLLLTIGMALIIVAVVVVLPMLMQVRDGRGGAA